ncbi:MAG: hypothetical protein KA099_12655 [Alphaproteobacteria bacterium]|nr:hypothetical protein [Alphaproteobacteria bacterium]MBP7763506.1 hypothetical protein [Alphaproteobacteria bacterium]MBP7906161.1 hypothetical protein [Alphaproteobacteria bacterium]
MPIPFAAAAGTALWTGVRWGGGRLAALFGKNMTLGGAAAVAAGPTLISALDNATGNALSETLIKTPIGPALEALLKAHEWSQDQKALVVTNLIDGELEKRGLLSKTDPDYQRSKSMSKALGHLIVGDPVGAASIASELGIETSDLVESYNQAKAANPNGTIQEVGAASFANLREKVRQRALQRSAVSQPQVSGAASPVPSSTPLSTPSTAPPAGGSAASSRATSVSLEGLSNESISSAFEAAADMKGGIVGFLMKTASAISGIFGQSAQAYMQKTMLTMLDTETRLAALQQGARNGQVVSRLGDRFGVQHQMNYTPELANS